MTSPSSSGSGRRRRRRRVGSDPSSPLVKEPPKLGKVQVVRLLTELVALHEKGGDPYVEQMPEPTEDLLLGVLRHAETHGRRLQPDRLRGEAALRRTRLWQYLFEQVPVRQSAAVEDARAVGIEWHELVEPLAVSKPNGAYNKAKRLKGTALRVDVEGRPLRRTPEAVARAEADYAEAERVRRLRAQAAVAEYECVRTRAQEFLERWEEIEAGDVPDATGELWGTWWLEQIEIMLEEQPTEKTQVALAAAVEALTDHLAKR